MSNSPPGVSSSFRRPTTAGGSRPISAAGSRVTLGYTSTEIASSGDVGPISNAKLKFSTARKNLEAGMELFSQAQKALRDETGLLESAVRLRLLGPPLHKVLGEAMTVMRFDIYGWSCFMDDIEWFCKEYENNARTLLEVAKTPKGGEHRLTSWLASALLHMFPHIPPGMAMFGDPLGKFFKGPYRQRLDETRDFLLLRFVKEVPGRRAPTLSWNLK
jgi:hypothetical protein